MKKGKEKNGHTSEKGDKKLMMETETDKAKRNSEKIYIARNKNNPGRALVQPHPTDVFPCSANELGFVPLALSTLRLPQGGISAELDTCIAFLLQATCLQQLIRFIQCVRRSMSVAMCVSGGRPKGLSRDSPQI